MGVYWGNFPRDLLTQIFSYLPQKELVRASEVCMGWKQIHDKEDFWKLYLQSADSLFFKHRDLCRFSDVTFKLGVKQIRSLKSLKLAHTFTGLSQSAFEYSTVHHKSQAVWDINCYNKKGYSFPQSSKVSSPNSAPVFTVKAEKLLSEHDEIGFFSEEAEDKENYSRLVKLVHLSKGVELATLDLKEILSPEELSDRYLQHQHCVAAFMVGKNQFMTLSSYGVVAEWKDIYHPKLISKIRLPETENQRDIEEVFRTDDYLILQERCETDLSAGPWIRVFDLKLKEVICELSLNQTNIFQHHQILSDGKILIDIPDDRKIQAFQYKPNERTFSKIWEQTLPGNIKVCFKTANFSSEYPYMLLINKDLKTNLYTSFTVLNIHDGTKIFTIDTPKAPCVSGAYCNREGFGGKPLDCLFDFSSYFLIMDDAVFRISRHQMEMWLIPSGYHYVILLPLLNIISNDHFINLQSTAPPTGCKATARYR